MGDDISGVIAEMGGDSDAARINMRTIQVRDRYKKALESVYSAQTAHLHLAHTNNVVIKSIKGVKTLVVYVDDSLFAAELNAQRELIKLMLQELFSEEVEEFKIRVSAWKKYREKHPYIDEESENSSRKTPSIPLDDHERSFVSRVSCVIKDEKVRKSLERAMTADLEWKKGEKVKTESRDTK